VSDTGVVVTLSPRDYDAVLFDLDGVLTRTASVHAAAWKKLCDGFLERRAADMGEPFVPFDIDADYRRYVDGKPRHDGVAAFLAARSIDLPCGTPEDGPGLQTVHALGNLKDQYFTEYLQQHGVERYEDAIALVHTLRAQDVRAAVVSSSNNCGAVLEAAGIAPLFDVRVDGRDISRLGLHGKPAPDPFMEAARRLGVDASRAVVVDDAAAGVAAGRAGRFGCVIGVDRGGQSRALREAGADVVVTHLGQVQVAADPPSAWSLAYEGFDSGREGIREALCALGNGSGDPWGADHVCASRSRRRTVVRVLGRFEDRALPARGIRVNELSRCLFKDAWPDSIESVSPSRLPSMLAPRSISAPPTRCRRGGLGREARRRDERSREPPRAR
jgi:beta-phosphoglucomutase family hydrolase